MAVKLSRKNSFSLKTMLESAEKYQYAIGAFSARYTPMIAPILRACQKLKSPAIVQISNNEIIRYGISLEEFADDFYSIIDAEKITVPVVLHLDHTKDFKVIALAIEAGFNSVMIDASEKPLADNIQLSKEAAEYAHGHGVSIEAELGVISTSDGMETAKNTEVLTDPLEAQQFVNETKVDVLAVSCGTIHGVYKATQPNIDYDRLMAIRKLTKVHLALHGGSGVPNDMMRKAINLPGGGVSKVNIATDLELSLLERLGRKERMTNAECRALPPDLLSDGLDAVEQKVAEKIEYFLDSKGKVW